jgi:hypothetical protein
MNAITIPDLSSAQAALNAVIIYDDFEFASKANSMFGRAANSAGEPFPWTVKPWRLDMLSWPMSAEAALRDAADAHLVFLCLRHPSSLPSWLLGWLEQWASRRQVQDAALAVWDGGNGDTLSKSDAPELFEFARRNGLSFIFGDAGLVQDDLPVLVRDFRDREAISTPPLPFILDTVPLSPSYAHDIGD